MLDYTLQLPVAPNRRPAEKLMWTICQIGAREHFSIPRALVQAGVPVHLITDYWKSSRIGSLAGGRLTQRFHPDLDNTAVTAFNLNGLWHEVVSRVRGRTGWQRMIERDKWFGRHAACKLQLAAKRSAGPGVVFSYSYAAEEIFEAAGKLGHLKILGQIDPGPAEIRVVAKVHEQAGLPFDGKPPSTYWDRWRQECDLADLIVVNSEWSAAGLREEGIPAEKLRIIPLVYEAAANTGIRSREYPDSFSEDRPLRSLFLGQVFARKGILELCEAAELLKAHPVEWIVVGGGDERLLTKLRSQHRVRVVGPVSRAETAAYYRQADLFLLPTHSDGFALTQLEAASHGLPIVASRCCGEVVSDGVNGRLLPEVAGVAIATIVQEYLQSPKLLRQHAEAVRQQKPRSLSDLANDLLAIAT